MSPSFWKNFRRYRAYVRGMDPDLRQSARMMLRAGLIGVAVATFAQVVTLLDDRGRL